MAQICPVCKGDDISNGLDRARCLNCDTVLAYGDNLDLVEAKDSLPTNPVLNAYDGPLEPEQKGGPGAAVASQGGVTEDALQQSGAVPQHGLSIPAADNTSVPSDAGVNYDQRPDPLQPVLAGAKTVEDERNTAREWDVEQAEENDDADGEAARRMMDRQNETAGPARADISVERAVELKGDNEPKPDNTPVEETGGGAHGTSTEQLEQRDIEVPAQPGENKGEAPLNAPESPSTVEGDNAPTDEATSDDTSPKRTARKASRKGSK